MNVQDRIQTLFNPKSIAIIGASKTIGKWGFTFVLHLTHGEYKGKIYPVNPSGGEFLGHTVYRNLKEIPETVDLAFILLPPPKVA
ncbi:MAG: acetyl CoA synthetase, partial [Proteobacteria bacterium]|nr:acetyl CoA synthetase [Pseudomonadota bacterium]